MAFNKENYFRIKEEFSHKHRDRINEAEQRRAELEGKYTELAEINSELRMTGAEVYSAIVSKNNTELKLAGIKKKNDALLEKRRDFLSLHKLPEDYLDPHYDCPICEDRGSVNLKMCSCMKKALVLAGYDSSGMKRLLDTCSFDNFDLIHFKKSKRDYENISLAFTVCREYAQTFTTDAEHVCGGSKNLFLSGPTGLGKTHLCAAMSKCLIDRGYDVLYDTALDIFAIFEDERYGAARFSTEKKSRRLFDCDILIIDDLGTEVANQFTNMVLFNLLNTRINLSKPTIINSNLPLSSLQGRYEDRITSRILGEFRPLVFSGTDYRALRLM